MARRDHLRSALACLTWSRAMGWTGLGLKLEMVMMRECIGVGYGVCYGSRNTGMEAVEILRWG